MAFPDWFIASAGSWAGKSRLHLPWLEDGQHIRESDSDLLVTISPNGEFGSVQYTWEDQGESHQGTLILAGESGAWVDSWHQSGAVMALSGENLVLEGKYSTGGDSHWRWRVQLLLDDATLILLMTNIDPNGAEEWAVEGTYHRLA
jgi:hypothetical protein